MVHNEDSLRSFARARRGRIVRDGEATEVRWSAGDRVMCLMRFETRVGVPVSMLGVYRGRRERAELSSLYFGRYETLEDLAAFSDGLASMVGDLYAAAYRRRW